MQLGRPLQDVVNTLGSYYTFMYEDGNTIHSFISKAALLTLHTPNFCVTYVTPLLTLPTLTVLCLVDKW